MLILNRLDRVQHVQIVNIDGSKDSVHLQPRGGNAVQLPAGTQLDPAMLAIYADTLRTEPKIVLPQPTPAAPAFGSDTAE